MTHPWWQKKKEIYHSFFLKFDVIFIALADGHLITRANLPPVWQKKACMWLKSRTRYVPTWPSLLHLQKRSLRECVGFGEGCPSDLTHTYTVKNSPSPACSCIYAWSALPLVPSAHFIIHTYSTVATGNATISASTTLLHFIRMSDWPMLHSGYSKLDPLKWTCNCRAIFKEITKITAHPVSSFITSSGLLKKPFFHTNEEESKSPQG